MPSNDGSPVPLARKRAAPPRSLNEPPSKLQKAERLAPAPPHYDDLADMTFEDELCDAIAALRLLHQQFPRADQARGAVVVLQSQLYSICKNRTAVDRELDDLRRRNVVRLVKVNCGPDERAVCETRTYRDIVARARDKCRAQGAALSACFDWFACQVLPGCTEMRLQRTRLLQLLNQGARLSGAAACDAHVSLLLNAGLLARDAANTECLAFALPAIGPVVAAVNAGKKELLRLLQRRRFPEVLEAELYNKTKKLRGSFLDMRFHVRHLIGCGLLERRDTAAGPSLALVRRG